MNALKVLGLVIIDMIIDAMDIIADDIDSSILIVKFNTWIV